MLFFGICTLGSISLVSVPIVKTLDFDAMLGSEKYFNRRQLATRNFTYLIEF